MNNYFGENLKQLRLQKGLTQEKLAEFLNVSFQSVSKWERGNVLPDITMIPVIASFFHVSTDYLLGMNQYESESSIQNYVDTYYRLWQERKFEEVYTVMKQAVKEYPGDFRLLVRYMNALIQYSVMQAKQSQKETAGTEQLRNREEIESLYERIQDYCTTDSIRIWSKKLLCDYYRALGQYRVPDTEEGRALFGQIRDILDEMPLMQNCRDFLACSYYPEGQDKDHACRTAVNELLFLLYKVVYEKFNNQDSSMEEKIEAFERVAAVFDLVYPNGDYGKNFMNYIYLHGYLARWTYLPGQPERTLEHLGKCVKLAAAFDQISLDDEYKQESLLVKGMKIPAKDMLFSQGGQMRRTVRDYFMKSRNYTDELYQNPEYLELLKLLD